MIQPDAHNVMDLASERTSEKVPTEIAFTYSTAAPPMVVWRFQIPSDMPRS